MYSLEQHPARTLTWWYGQRENIDMDPPYQRRGLLWSKPDKQYLIDTILNDYDIPKLYLVNFAFISTPMNVRKLRFAVVDGKQRFEAIFGFFEDRFPLAGDFVLHEDPTRAVGGMTYSDLRRQFPDLASRFENYNLTVMTLATDDDQRINDLFIRLNRSKPLTGAEIRNAMEGAVPGMIRDVAAHEFFKSRIAFNVQRGADLNAAAKVLLIEFRGQLVDTKKRHLDRLVSAGIRSAGASPKLPGDVFIDGFIETAVEVQSDNLEGALRRTRRVLDRMTEVFLSRDPLLTTQGPVTLYYWFVRNFPATPPNEIRDFLVQFESDRRLHRKAVQAGLDKIDDRLSLFEQYHRSTNDQRSLEIRFDIMVERFRPFVGRGLSNEVAGMLGNHGYQTVSETGPFDFCVSTKSGKYGVEVKNWSSTSQRQNLSAVVGRLRDVVADEGYAGGFVVVPVLADDLPTSVLSGGAVEVVAIGQLESRLAAALSV